MKIYGIAGSNGSGKDTVSNLLASRYGFFAASATTMLADELEKRGLPTDRQHKRELSAEWRRQYGMAAIVDKAIEVANADGHEKIIVGSLRHPGEADRVHELGGEVIWVDADPEVRYARITQNDRGRIEDKKTYEEFLAEEEAEKYPTGDGATLSTEAVKERADIFIINNEDIASFERMTITALGLDV